MKIARLIKGWMVAMATAGVLVPHSAVHAAEAGKVITRAEQSAELFADVSLDQQGVLHGQVVNSTGVAIANTQVIIRQQDRTVAQTTSDAQGRFAVSEMKAGVYAVSTQEGTQLCRVWSHRAAPPSAAQSVLLVNEMQVVRGQLQGNFAGIALGGLLLGGLIAAITAASVDHNSAS